MEVAQLRLLLEVARRGSFAEVARDRDLAPSSVSRAVASVEEELGFDLFTRTTRQLSATDAGERYLRRIEPLVEELEQAAEDAAAGTRDPQGVLRVLAPVSFAQLNVVPLLPAFLERYPGLRVDLRLTDALLDLVEERIDLALRLGPLADSTYIGRRLAPMRSHVCASPAYLERHGHPATPEELAQHHCLLLDMPGFGRRWHFRDRDGASSQVDVSGSLTTSNAIALKQCALDGAGVILQGDWIVGRELRDGTLIDLFPDLEATASSFDNAIWVLRPAQTHVPAKVNVFLAYLLDAFARGAPWSS
ncbi:MAG: LysR family transcriptional regulator [Planctomycetota bacterium]